MGTRRRGGWLLVAVALGLGSYGWWRSQHPVLLYTAPEEYLGGTLFVDGRLFGVAQPQPVELRLTKGRHSIRLEKPGLQPVHYEVDLAPLAD